MAMKKLVLILAVLIICLPGQSQQQNVIAKRLQLNGNWLVDSTTGDTIASAEWVRTYVPIILAEYPTIAEVNDSIDTKIERYNDTVTTGLTQPLDSASFSTDVAVEFNEYTIKADTANHTFTVFLGESEISPQLFLESYAIGYNNTGSTLTDLTVVYSDSSNISTFGNFKRAIANDFNKVGKVVGILTHDVEPGTIGFAVVNGNINKTTHGFTLGQDLYLSDTSETENIIQYRPMAPNYAVNLGHVLNDSVIKVHIGSFDNTDTEVNIEGALNGVATYKPALYDTVIGGLLYVDVGNATHPDQDLPYLYAGTRYLLNTTTGAGKNGRARIQLSYTTVTLPLMQNVYIDHNGGSPQLAVSTTGYPDEGIQICTYGVRNATKHFIYGFAYVRRVNNAVNGSSAMGMLFRIANRIRKDGSGIDKQNPPTPTVSIITGATRDTIRVTTTSGLGYQLNPQTINAIEPPYVWTNPPTGGDSLIYSLSDITVAADGTSLTANNARWRLNLFVNIMSGDYPSYISVTVSISTYGSDSDCTTDIGFQSVTTPPAANEDISVRYIALALRNNGGTITNLLGAGNYQDETNFPFGYGGTGGISGGGGTWPESDAIVSIYSNADPTAIAAISVAGVTTGSTSTQTWPTSTGALAQLADSSIFGSAYRDDTLQANIDEKATITGTENTIIASDGAGKGVGSMINVTYSLGSGPTYFPRIQPITAAGVGDDIYIMSQDSSSYVSVGDNQFTYNDDSSQKLSYFNGKFDVLGILGADEIVFPSGDTVTDIIKLNSDTSYIVIEQDTFIVLNNYAGTGGGATNQAIADTVDARISGTVNQIALFESANKVVGNANFTYTGTTKTAGAFYSNTTTPTETGVLSYDGIINNTAFYFSGNSNRSLSIGSIQDNFPNITATAYYNIGIGYNTFYSLTEGDYNLGITIGAYTALTTGSNNTGLNSAMSLLETGDDNLAISRGALNSIVGGTGNIGIGRYAGFNITNQSHRLVINSLNRNNILGDTTLSIIYGFQNAISSNQQLYLNTNVSIKHDLKVDGSVILGDTVKTFISTGSGTGQIVTNGNDTINFGGTGGGGAMTAEQINDSIKLRITRTFNKVIQADYKDIEYTDYTVATGDTITLDTLNRVIGSKSYVKLIGNGFDPVWGDNIIKNSTFNFNNTVNMINYTVVSNHFDKAAYNIWYQELKDISAPYLLSGIVNNANPDSMILTFNEAVFGSTNGFSITGYGSPTVTTMSTSSNTIGLLLSDSLTADSVYTVAYNSATGDIVDASSNALASFSDSSVTNNVVAGGIYDYVAYWPFDGDVLDKGGNYDLTNYGATLDGDTSYIFDGTNDYMTADPTIINELDTTTIGTWEIYLELDNATAINSIISAADASALTYIAISQQADGTTKIACNSSGTVQWSLATDAQVITSNTWTRITVTHNGLTPTIYIDGVEVAQTFANSTDITVWFNDLTGVDNMTIGDLIYNSTTPPSIYTFDGTIGYAVIYRRVVE